MRPRAHRLLRPLAVALVATAGALAWLAPVARAGPAARWPPHQRRELILARAASAFGQDGLAANLALGLTRERPDDAASWATLATVRGLAFVWNGGAPGQADEAQAAAAKARALDRTQDPVVVLAEGIAALVTAARAEDDGQVARACAAAETELTRVATDRRATVSTRFAAQVARAVLGSLGDDPTAFARRLADATATARDARLPGWWARRLRELALERADALGDAPAAIRLATEIGGDPAWGRTSETYLLLVRARAHLTLGRPQEALRELDRTGPGPGGGLTVDAWLLLGRPESALAAARRARNALGPRHEGDELVGRALLSLGRFDEARGALERAVRGAGAQCARCTGGLAVALARASEPTPADLARARRLARRAAEVDGSAPEALRARAVLARRDGDLARANALEGESRAASLPEAAARARALRERIRLATARGRWGEAAARAQDLLAERPGDLAALELFARALVAAHHPSAGPALEALADREPQDAWAHLERGKARLAAGRLREARRDLTRALDLTRAQPRSPVRGEAQAALAECRALEED